VFSKWSKEIQNIDLAPIGTTSFFAFWCHLVWLAKRSESKKDIVDSGLGK
jgi:hypothetical protein